CRARPLARREGQGPHRRRGDEAPALHRRAVSGRGRPSPRAPAGNQAVDGDWLVPRPAPPARPAGERPADEDERAHAQGPEEDRGPREEGKVTWPLPVRP